MKKVNKALLKSSTLVLIILIFLFLFSVFLDRLHLSSINYFVTTSSYMPDSVQRVQIFKRIFCKDYKYKTCIVIAKDSRDELLISLPTFNPDVFGLNLISNSFKSDQYKIIIYYEYSWVYIALIFVFSILISLFILLVKGYFKNKILKQELFAKIKIAESRAHLSLVASEMAHNIRSPLGALRMLAASFEGLNVKQAELLEKIIQKINFIADDLLKKSQQNDQSLEPHAQIVKEQNKFSVLRHADIHSLLNEIIDQKKLESNSLPIKYEYHCLPFEGSVLVDQLALSIVASNLINNAIDANLHKQKDAGFVNESTIKILVIEREKNKVLIVIEDDGIGFPMEVLDKSFLNMNRFTTKGKNGNGIGLIHAFKKINELNGTINFYNNQIKNGGVVEIHLPLIN